MSRHSPRLGGKLGTAGWLSLAVMAISALFQVAVVEPLAQRSTRLDAELERIARNAVSPDIKHVTASSPPAQLRAFYRFFDQRESLDYWLAKLYGTALASGLELRAADYYLAQSAHRLERYQVSLPVVGSYAQIRGFIEAALAEIPVLSLDQASFTRKAVGEARVEAQLIVTLHLPAR